MRKTLPLQTGGSKRTADSMVVQPGSSRPFMKDFAWYKQNFASKHREIKDLLKQFARIEDPERLGSRTMPADLEDGPRHQ